MAEDVQIAAVRGLIQRVAPEHSRFFFLSLISSSGMDAWEVETHSGPGGSTSVTLRGTSGVALASAFSWYLKYKCNSVYLWQEESLNLPSPLPEVSPKHSQNSTFSYRYYYNVCTLGYTTVFWDWARWEREIDWMAMNGINFPLGFVGQE